MQFTQVVSRYLSQQSSHLPRTFDDERRIQVIGEREQEIRHYEQINSPDAVRKRLGLRGKQTHY